MSVEFVLGDKLLRVFEVVQAIYDYAPGEPMTKETAKRTEAVTCYGNAVIKLWIKAFGPEHIKGKTPVKDQIRKYVKEFTTYVYKAKGKNVAGLSVRQKKKAWRELETSQCIFNIFLTKFDTENLDKDEKTFFAQQCLPTRKGYVSEYVDQKEEEVRGREGM